MEKVRKFRIGEESFEMLCDEEQNWYQVKSERLGMFKIFDSENDGKEGAEAMLRFVAEKLGHELIEIAEEAPEKASEPSKEVVKYPVQNGEKKMIGSLEFTANIWEKGSQHRIYFNSNNGKACWDMNIGEFIKCPGRVGAMLENGIREKFGLKN